MNLPSANQNKKKTPNRFKFKPQLAHLLRDAKHITNSTNNSTLILYITPPSVLILLNYSII